jgi:hypothetical protein
VFAQRHKLSGSILSTCKGITVLPEHLRQLWGCIEKTT